MKTTKRIFIGLVLLLLVAFIANSFYMSRIESPKYTVVKTLKKNIEVRNYPNMVIAKTKIGGQSFSKDGNDGFRSIAPYIFGSNDKQQKIAMTTPVVMEQSDDAVMYFIMPSEYEIGNLPKPNSSRVSIEEVQSKQLAVIRFGGFANDRRIEKHKAELIETLKKEKLSYKEPFLVMGYNAPWDLIFRRNEVAVELTK